MLRLMLRLLMLMLLVLVFGNNSKGQLVILLERVKGAVLRRRHTLCITLITFSMRIC